MESPTAVDCSPTIPYCHSSFRSLIHVIAPRFFSLAPFQHQNNEKRGARVHSALPPNGVDTVMITFFSHHRGKCVNLCIQHHARILLFLQLSVQTAQLTREMQSGVLCITLACNGEDSDLLRRESLYEVPVWRMYRNGRKVRYGVRRSKGVRGEEGVLRVMRKVSVGAGVVSLNGDREEDNSKVMYMRARFNQVVGSADAEAFRLINPVGCVGQELSLFLLWS